jgi:hypothetical protein
MEDISFYVFIYYYRVLILTVIPCHIFAETSLVFSSINRRPLIRHPHATLSLPLKEK